ncbi:MAG: hypothetical protein UU40_C0007G0047 [Candidatus Uhrbacteria bacterium GW2011_GWD2_41_121]|uniref:Uncharacterized protein n=1 Tax=Candidatus Uhrbacteria bacterium GW2011_GWC1_41_20 TaxID=1618983 RepID=A0A0G0VE89_9BACT|nr:MAG: hypothetical protein UT52_C0010G0047 [Candidatus Uhrbacteria bacterium GW2011_GWE1_39_46]KKR63896.1 MAG: hypothetical protein UU04_C0009G0005 [Candidatus Uhrbacteria bacterium GW2011_GWC2_40_450]KKR89668.1 MAG: hypothetical protein UU36_C0020G0005 [Candidatus Uhrbacteria bacterium GW2011_GWE2_41_1153]KKR90192.1 MAG: hypothetical protein UU40_C0007G0047 [Candidatus Uhrbacteria bacterium GW2011_GWD2_41_121]KKR99188.1 MAG: hypothetical protein UU50_C0009G0005 [Candidatus Uhrbacteria bacter
MIILTIISVAFCFMLEPEHILVQSADGVVKVEGLARESQDVSIDVIGNYLYKIEPAVSMLDQAMTITFDVSQAQFDFTIAVYKYNESLLMWEAVSSGIDPSVQEIVIDQSELGIYTVKQYVTIDVPDFLDTFGEILKMAPKNTVGYELATGFVTGDGSVIRISQKTELGGCDGIIFHGNKEEISQLERYARVYIDDVEQEVKFLIIGRWFVDETAGCDSGQVLGSVLEM